MLFVELWETEVVSCEQVPRLKSDLDDSLRPSRLVMFPTEAVRRFLSVLGEREPGMDSSAASGAETATTGGDRESGGEVMLRARIERIMLRLLGAAMVGVDRDVPSFEGDVDGDGVIHSTAVSRCGREVFRECERDPSRLSDSLCLFG